MQRRQAFPLLTNLTCFRVQAPQLEIHEFEQLTTITSLRNWLKEPNSSRRCFTIGHSEGSPTHWRRNYRAICWT